MDRIKRFFDRADHTALHGQGFALDAGTCRCRVAAPAKLTEDLIDVNVR